MNGAPVTSSATYSNAVATLRSVNGHSPAMASTFSNPPKWSAYASALSSASSGPSGASILSIVQNLWSLSMEPLVVQWVRHVTARTHRCSSTHA